MDGSLLDYTGKGSKREMAMEYEELFKRNYGIFSRDEQERIRQGSILIVGCGGIGGTVAIMLARSGVSRFVLTEFDTYEPTNMNRQINCFVDTIYRNKAEVIKEDILRINPEAEVEAYEELTHSEIAEMIPRVDLVFPAADNLAFSIFIFRDARRLGKTALMVFPSGTWANVSIIPPDKPSPEDIEGVPKLTSYEELRDTLEIRKYRFGLYFYVPVADWRIDYFRGFVEEGFQPTQICPTIWICSSLGALEALKFFSGKWKPVASPRYWYITKEKIRVNRINRPSLQTFLVWQRKFMWWVFQTRFGPFQEGLQRAWWGLYYPWVKRREERGS
jgi:molybdopterin/thiamine biosynthesis adenylyltransferase